MSRRLGLAAVIGFALGGCASAPTPSCARLALSGWFCPLPPDALAPRTGVALITVQQDTHKSVYVGQLAITATALRLALANPAGVPLATLVWDGSTASVNPSGTGLQPKLLLALLELTYTNPERLQSGLHGLSLDKVKTPAGARRMLRAEGAIVAVVEYSGENVRVNVPRAHLTVTIQPLAGER
ncbi:MAG: DUF3261 domain-containing protein [Gammaproteobacteria bacterium]